MGRNLPAGIQAVTTYETAWRPYLAVLSDGDRQLVKHLFTRLRRKSTRIIDAGRTSRFELSAAILFADVLNHAIRRKRDMETREEVRPYKVGEGGHNWGWGKVQRTRTGKGE